MKKFPCLMTQNTKGFFIVANTEKDYKSLILQGSRLATNQEILSLLIKEKEEK